MSCDTPSLALASINVPFSDTAFALRGTTALITYNRTKTFNNTPYLQLHSARQTIRELTQQALGIRLPGESTCNARDTR